MQKRNRSLIQNEEESRIQNREQTELQKSCGLCQALTDLFYQEPEHMLGDCLYQKRRKLCHNLMILYTF